MGIVNIHSIVPGPMNFYYVNAYRDFGTKHLKLGWLDCILHVYVLYLCSYQNNFHEPYNWT